MIYNNNKHCQVKQHANFVCVKTNAKPTYRLNPMQARYSIEAKSVT